MAKPKPKQRRHSTGTTTLVCPPSPVKKPAVSKQSPPDLSLPSAAAGQAKYIRRHHSDEGRFPLFSYEKEGNAADSGTEKDGGESITSNHQDGDSENEIAISGGSNFEIFDSQAYTDTSSNMSGQIPPRNSIKADLTFSQKCDLSPLLQHALRRASCASTMPELDLVEEN